MVALQYTLSDNVYSNKKNWNKSKSIGFYSVYTDVYAITIKAMVMFKVRVAEFWNRFLKSYIDIDRKCIISLLNNSLCAIIV